MEKSQQQRTSADTHVFHDFPTKCYHSWYLMPPNTPSFITLLFQYGNWMGKMWLYW